MRHLKFTVVFLAAAFVAVSVHAKGSNIPALDAAMKNKGVKAALASADASKDVMIEEWIKLAEISAPSKHEDARAEYIMKRFRELGLSDVRRDSFGNVVGVLKGKTAPEKFVVFDAHLDTVVKPGTEVKVRRDGSKLHAGGVGDDTAGLIGLLYAVKAMKENGVMLKHDIVFTASVQEEIGLVGASHYVAENASKIGKYVSVDGELGSVSYGATSIYWFKFHFKSEGSHTLHSYGKPSTTHAAARAIGDLYALPLARDPEEKKTWLNLGMLGGGEVPNAQCRDAWFTVDLRSNDRDEIAAMEKKVKAVGQNAADLVGVAFESEEIQRLEGTLLPGHKDSEFVKGTLEVMKAAGVAEPKSSMLGSSNHNTALLKGIPGINIGVTKGEGAHTPTEWVDTDPAPKGVKQLILLMAWLGGAE